jgi:hypothetical protein
MAAGCWHMSSVGRNHTHRVTTRAQGTISKNDAALRLEDKLGAIVTETGFMTLERRIERLEEAERQRTSAPRKRTLIDDARVQDATRDPYVWATDYTETYNPHWVEEGRKSPYEKFPPFEEYPHLFDLFELLKADVRHDIIRNFDD